MAKNALTGDGAGAQAGSNMPEFRSVQLDFAAHIRNPDINPRPADIEPRRMKIYVDLFYNNIKSFLDSAFPIAKEILGDDRWRALAREFVHRHPSESPYFLQISEEFLTFLHDRGLDDLPPFLLELCHYEWVELSLDVAVDDAVAEDCDADGDLLEELVVSPLYRALGYAYPVHQIGVDNQPQTPPAVPTFLVVYRNEALKVRFIESNPLTHRLLELLPSMSAREALLQIRTELAAAGREVSEAEMLNQGRQTLTHLRDVGIILGNKKGSRLKR